MAGSTVSQKQATFTLSPDPKLAPETLTPAVAKGQGDNGIGESSGSGEFEKDHRDSSRIAPTQLPGNTAGAAEADRAAGPTDTTDTTASTDDYTVDSSADRFSTYGKISVDQEVGFKSWTYDLVLWMFASVFDIFFREILSRGAYRIPKTGPVIFVAAPHANQFVDPIMLMQQAKKASGRRLSFLVAETSLKRRFIGAMSRAAHSIGVVRAQDNLKPGTGTIKVSPEDPLTILGTGTKFTTECMPRGLLGLPKSAGSAEISEIVSDTELKLRKEFKGTRAVAMLKAGVEYKRADHVDQSAMFHKVFDHLHKGGCIGIFPEGGSHDRTELLPLKAGVAIMALGAIAEQPDAKVKVVPCGMNYFHPNKFRSRAVIEFGSPIDIPAPLVAKYKQGGDAKRAAVKQVLDMVTDALRSVTVTSSDYETLMVIQAARRLYRPTHKKMPLPLVVELNRRLIKGYETYKDEPQIVHLREAVLEYNKELKNLGLKDHQVERATLSLPMVVAKLASRLIKLLALSLLALPGAILFSPIFIATKRISRLQAAKALKNSTVKVAARDVIATWKVLVAMGLAPLLYTLYALLATYITWRRNWVGTNWRSLLLVILASYIILPAITYSALVIGETGMDIFKSLRPLALALSPFHKNAIEHLKESRRALVLEVAEAINQMGPKLFPDFNKYYMKYNEEKIAAGEVDDESELFEPIEDKEAEAQAAAGSATGTATRITRSGSSRSISSEASSDSNSISRVNSESGLANIPLFSSIHHTSHHSRAASGASGVHVDLAGHPADNGATGTSSGHKSFQSEISRRIRGAMEERQRQQYPDESDDEDEE